MKNLSPQKILIWKWHKDLPVTPVIVTNEGGVVVGFKLAAESSYDQSGVSIPIQEKTLQDLYQMLKQRYE